MDRKKIIMKSCLDQIFQLFDDILLVIPNVMGIVIWSPKLDEIGNSYRGVEFCKLFVGRR